jgi:hypothetical protein
LDVEANKLDVTCAWDRREFYRQSVDRRGPDMFLRLQHMQQPAHDRLAASKPQAGIIFAIVDDLRRARSAVQKRNRLPTNAAEMNDSCESPGNYEKFTDNQARLFRRVEGRVAESAQCRTTSRENTV